MRKVPAHIQPYIEALGVDAGVEFLIAMGGSYVYFTDKPQSRSQVVDLVGVDKAAELGRLLGKGGIRVPIAKPFIAQHYRDQGMSINAIARKLHVTDVSVRNWIKQDEGRQLKLL